MIKPGYLTHKPAAPSAPKRHFDQQVMPVLIDAAGGVEAVLEQVAIRVRQSPVRTLSAAAGTASVLSFLLKRRQA
jgi:hypothetical protein